MNLINSEATTAQCFSGTTLSAAVPVEILLHPAGEGQKPKTDVQGLHLLSFGSTHLIFSCIILFANMHTYMYYVEWQTCCKL